MIPLATIAFRLLGIGKAIGGAVKAGARWALSDIRHIAIVALVVAVGVLWLQSGKWQGRAEKALATVEKRDKTITDMKQASETAKQTALANAARVKAEYERIGDNAKITYNRALDDNRVTVDRWLRKNNRGATGQANSATAPKVSTGIARAEIMPELPSGFVILPESDLGKIADIQATLYALQQAARGVERVQTVPTP